MINMPSTLRSNPLVPVLGLALLLVTALLVWLLAGQMGPAQAVDSGEHDVVLAQSSTGDTEEPTDDASAVDAAAIEVSYDVFLDRDPFESIMPPEPVSVDDPADPTDPTIPTDPADPTAPGAPGDPTRPDDKEPVDSCRTGTEAVCDGRVVVVTQTTSESATIEVNGTAFVVVPGQTFAGNFTLLEVDGDCVQLLYLNGDRAQVVQQCIGDVTVK